MSEIHNPYIGIRPFRTEESHLFFGREANIAELKEKLTCRFLSIVGTSGSGKSSLVRAGLIPSLMKDGWIVGSFRPQAEPIKNLISTLSDKDVLDYSPDKESKTKKFDPFGTEAIAEYYLKSSKKAPLVLVIDQFEEIFRYNTLGHKSKEVSIRFVNMLIDAISQKECPIYIVITLRSEFLGRCSEFHGLTEWINKGQYLVPRLEKQQFRRVITGFKDLEEYRSINMSSELITKLLDDIGDDTDQLPVLQHALMRTWHEWEKSGDDLIDLKHYTVTGEMQASVSNHAEDILRELKYQGYEKETKIIFQRITEIDYDSNKVRNPTTLSVLIELNGGKKEEVIKIIEAFRAEGRNFLRPDYQIELEGDTMIDVAHESLIRQWRTLGKWMREEAENAREYRLINQRRENQETEGLLLNPRLAISNYWWMAHDPGVIWASRYHVLDSTASKSDHRKIFNLNEKFLEESLEEQERIDEANKTELERKKEQRFQRVTYLTIGLVIIALILGLFSRRNQILRDNAVESAQMAFMQARQADSALSQAVIATNQALIEKSIADSLRQEATVKSQELLVANEAADNLKNQAIEERELAESRSIDARIAEIGALISESRAKVNEIDANILKLTSEYKEKIEEAKKQALVSIILDDIEEQKVHALSSFEKFDTYNTLLMGLGSNPEKDSETKSIDYYVQSIDSVRSNLESIIKRINNWIVEIDPNISEGHRTFLQREVCDIDLSLPADASELLTRKLDSLLVLKNAYVETCWSIEEVSTEREWEKVYPIENHRALLESYVSSFNTSKSSIGFGELRSFAEGSVEVNFEIMDSPASTAPEYIAGRGLDQLAYIDASGKVILEKGNSTIEFPTQSGSLKFIDLFENDQLVIANFNELKVFDYSHNPYTEIKLEESEQILSLDYSKNKFVGLNNRGEILIWNMKGKLVNRYSPDPDIRITAMDCLIPENSDTMIIAVGTELGRLHLLKIEDGELQNTGFQFNRLYAGEEPRVKHVRFSPNGNFLATASSKQLDIWPLTQINNSNSFQSIFEIQEISNVSYQFSPIPMGRNESIQTNKGIGSITFDKSGDFLLYSNNSRIHIKPINIYFMCQSLGSKYCSGTAIN